MSIKIKPKETFIKKLKRFSKKNIVPDKFKTNKTLIQSNRNYLKE
jgi:hypothetical protein